MTTGDQPLEVRPVRYLLDDDTADLLASGGTLEVDPWPPADRYRFVLRWLGVATVIAGVLLIVLEITAPWKG